MLKLASVLWAPFKLVLNIIFRIVFSVTGELQWQSPVWWGWLNNVRNRRPKPFWGALIGGLLLMGTAVGGYLYYESLPKPLLIKASVTSPGVTPNTETLVPSWVQFEFDYDLSTLTEGMEVPQGRASVASLDLIGKKIESGIRITPKITGDWRWDTDSRLIFEPKEDWPADQEYQITFNPSLFAKDAKLKTYEYSVTTPKFSVMLNGVEFYQDPKEKNLRKVISRFRFTHSVNEESFEKNLQLSMRESGADINSEPRRYGYSIQYDKHKREASVHSEPVNLPEKENYFHVVLEKGVRTTQGMASTNTSTSGKVIIPDIYSFLKVKSQTYQIVENSDGDPEQILSLVFTDSIDVSQIKENVKLYILPQYYNSRQVTPVIVEKSKPIEYQLIPNQREDSLVYSLKTDIAEGAYVYVSVAQGLKSTNKFKLSSRYENVVRSPRYPRDVNFMSDGTILSLGGEKTLSFKARGIDGIKVTLSRLLDNSLNHLITQTDGNLEQPNFNYEYYFNKNNITTTQEKYLPLKKIHPKKTNFSSLNMSEFLDEKGLGVFFVEVQGWDTDRNRSTTGANSRLIIVTDLGVIVKHDADGEQHVFVQSVSSGQPVLGARVALLGKNGLPVYQGKTDVGGYTKFGPTAGFDNENTPTVYRVSRGEDTAFIPYNRYTQQIEYSKFDIGGSRTTSHAGNKLTAYVFSDRGIYRPGDNVNIGAIVKQKDFSVRQGTPIAIQINDARGSRVKYEKRRLPEKGFLAFDLKTELDSSTGNYQASVYLLDKKGRHSYQLGHTSFKVEEFQPDTLKITTRLDPAAEQGWVTAEKIIAKVALTNLFGSPAQERRVNGSLRLTPANFSFTRYKGYQFTDPTTSKDLGHSVIAEHLPTATTNADGQAEFRLALDKYDEGTYTLQFSAEGFEAGGGRSVKANSRILVSPFGHIVGFKADGGLKFLKRNQKRSLHFIAIDNDLKKSKLTNLKLERIQKEPISSLVQQFDGTFKYQTIIKDKIISTEGFSIGNEGASYSISTEEPGTYELRVINENGQQLNKLTYEVVGAANLAGSLEKNAELTLKLNKSDYKIGERIQLNVTAPYKGAGLITIESDKVHAFKWFSSETNSSMQEIEIPEGIEGNAYVNVTFLRNSNSREIFTSPLSYAVQSFNLDRTKREVNISLKAPELARPGKPMSIEYSTDKPSKIVLFAVNEGILQVARYQTPQPLDYFLTKKALLVKTFQILDLILPEYSVLREAAGIGGGMEKMRSRMLGANLNPFTRTRDKPAVYWSGIIDADTETRKVTFTVPDTFSGELRVMAVSVADDAVGVATDRTVVRGPFVLSPNVLTAAAPSDEFVVTLGISNQIENSGKNADVTVELNVSDNLEVIGKTEDRLKISEGSEGKSSFRIRVKERLGEGRIVFKALHGNEDASRTATLSVRPATSYSADFYSGYTKSGNTNLVLPRKLRPELAVQEVSASGQPLVLVNGLTNYLEHYPHGCTEQLVSQVFPWLSLASSSTFVEHISETHEKFQTLISSLRKRQASDGGFSLWPGVHHSDAFPSVYAMHFLTEARESGYSVPQDMYRLGRDYLRRVARGQQGQNPSYKNGQDKWYDIRIRANAIYLLTRDGEVTTNYLVDLETYLEKNHKNEWKNDLTGVYLAATYKLLKKDKVAESIILKYKIGNKTPRETSDFHSGLTMDAQYIFILSKHFPEQFQRLKGDDVLSLVEPIFNGNYNTISSSYTTIALSAYSEAVKALYGEDNIHFTQTDTEGVEKALSILTHLPLPEVNVDTKAREVNIDSDASIFYLASQAGYDSKLPEKALRKDLEITRDFLDEDGNEISEILQGSEVTVRLRIRSLANKTQTNVAVIDLLPGGFEVIRSSVPREIRYWQSDYVDVREDRVVFYGSFGKSVTELTYRAKATTEGVFVTPPAYAESMYDRSVKAHSEAGTFNVLSGGE